ncbi:MAG: beta-ketoacyl-ACP synthase II [Thermodesulfobacteriota bacterium]
MSPQQPLRRVVVTGIGLVTPLGIGIRETWSALCSGKSGVVGISRFDATGFTTRIAAEVRNFQPKNFLTAKEANRTELFVAYGLAAGRLAVEDAGLTIDHTNSHRTGVLTGCGFGGLASLERTCDILRLKGPGRVSPFFIPMMIGNMAAGMISIHLNARGPNSSIATACAAGTHAIGEAFNLIRRGAADAMITGGTEALVTPTCIAGFNALKALSTRNHEPEKACRPFDKDRDGFVVGEGSGMLVLETLAAARERGARIYAEITGFGMSSDGFHITAPPPDGEGAARCMQAALGDAGLSPTDIDYINAHGTGTPLNDLAETRAIKTVFGPHAGALAVSSTKSMTGHLLGGAGGIETAFTALAIHHGVIPPTINLDQPDDGCDLDYVPHKARDKQVRAAMNNSFGFGGTNACLVLQAHDGFREKSV